MEVCVKLFMSRYLW